MDGKRIESFADAIKQREEASAGMARGQEAAKCGARFDAGKTRWDLLPAAGLAEVANVCTYGLHKYDADNWRKGLKFAATFGSMMRHAWAWLTGEQRDPESGCHHLAHVAWNALVLIEFESLGRAELDDRARGVAPLPGPGSIREPVQRLTSLGVS